MNKNNDTAMAIIRDVKMYLKETDMAEPDLNKLLNIKQLESFMKKMKDQKEYKATTMAEKLRRIRLAIKYMTRGKDDQLYNRGTRVVDLINEWSHGLGKDIAIQRQQHALFMRQKIQKIIDLNEFLENDKVR